MGVPEAHGAIDTMTSLNPSLRLALSNKARTKKSILQKGFTLVELLITVAILGTLSAIALPSFLQYQKDGLVASSEAEALAKGRICAADMAKGVEADTGSCEAAALTATGNDGKMKTQAIAIVSNEGIVSLDTEAEAN